MVVPSVVSLTVMPIIRPSVNRLLTMRWPNSVFEANSSSRCSGCTFMVSELNSTLSISVTVRVQAWSNMRPTVNSSKYSPAIFLPAKAGLSSMDGRCRRRHRINAATGRNRERTDARNDQRNAGRAGEPEADGAAIQAAGQGPGARRREGGGRQFPRHADHRRQVPVQATAPVRAGPRGGGRHHRSGRGRERATRPATG